MMTASSLTSSRVVFRAMLRDGDGQPRCGSGDCMLGARLKVDVRPDAEGRVLPNGGGMSVTPDDPRRLPPHFRPVSLGGFGALPVFGLKVAKLSADLCYRADPKKPDRHGTIEPAAAMFIGVYQGRLFETRPIWEEMA